METATPAIALRRPWMLAVLVSVASVAVGLMWLAAPSTYPYGSGDNVRTGINHLIERGPAVAIVSTLGVLGVLLAIVAVRGGTRTALRIAGAGAIAETLCFAFVMSDSGVMAALGYLVAFCAPLGIVLVVVLVCRRWPPVGIVLAIVLLLLIVAGFVTGALSSVGEAVANYLGGFLDDANGYYARTAWSLGMAAAAGCWAWTAVASLLSAAPDDRSRPASANRELPTSQPRWGRVVTVVAALGPVPYGLIRLTWLTPWPLGGGGADEFVITGQLTTAARIQGGLFALACVVGVILTLGLISRWGEVFPRWIPVLGGRDVPIMLATVPGGLVAAIITISAPGVMVVPIERGDLREIVLSFVAFPFPIWGPMLGAAVFAYWRRRTQQKPLDAATSTT